MFFFFSNRLGCLGSVLLSAALTVVLIAIFPGSASGRLARYRLPCSLCSTSA